jgi:AbiTii
VELPEYRKLTVSYKGTWSGPYSSSISKAPIPRHLIEEFAGDRWLSYEMRKSIVAVDDLLSRNNHKGSLQIDASDLILLLQGNVYPDLACNSVNGYISATELREIQYAVRCRILELTLELEKTVPAAADVTLGKSRAAEVEAAEAVTQVFNQTIHGHFTNVTSTGANARVSLTVTQGDAKAMIGELVRAGIPQDAAREFAEIVASERPESAESPFGERARDWLARNIGKAADGTWKAGKRRERDEAVSADGGVGRLPQHPTASAVPAPSGV